MRKGPQVGAHAASTRGSVSCAGKYPRNPRTRYRRLMRAPPDQRSSNGVYACSCGSRLLCLGSNYKPPPHRFPLPHLHVGVPYYSRWAKSVQAFFRLTTGFFSSPQYSTGECYASFHDPSPRAYRTFFSRGNHARQGIVLSDTCCVAPPKTWILRPPGPEATRTIPDTTGMLAPSTPVSRPIVPQATPASVSDPGGPAREPRSDIRPADRPSLMKRVF